MCSTTVSSTDSGREVAGRWYESPWLWLGGGALVAGYVYYETPEGGAAIERLMTMGYKETPKSALARQLAQKWGPVFGAPVDVLMVLAKIESGFRPGLTNLSPRALARGGAWGLVQQTLETAKGHAVALVKHSNTQVRTTLATKWHGNGSDLLDPDLNMMMAAYQVGKLAKEFGADLPLIAAGYHQGAGKVRAMQKAKKPIPAELPPKGKQYVSMALAAQRLLTA
jgi:soluble lytic murein transglycosylase-like protein